jgi:excisionase family DNA binding protein
LQNPISPSVEIFEAGVDASRTSEDRTAATSAYSEWLTAAEAAQYLKIRVRTLLLWVRQGKVKGYALSGIRRHVWRFRHEDLDAAFVQPTRRDVLHSPSSSVRSAEKGAA